jgi:hypothetical protein
MDDHGWPWLTMVWLWVNHGLAMIYHGQPLDPVTTLQSSQQLVWGFLQAHLLNLIISPKGCHTLIFCAFHRYHVPIRPYIWLEGIPGKTIWAKNSYISLKMLKTDAAYIGVGLMGPSHCLTIDGCLYWVLQPLYYWWLPILGLQLMECHKKALNLGKYFAFCGLTRLLMGKWYRWLFWPLMSSTIWA